MVWFTAAAQRSFAILCQISRDFSVVTAVTVLALMSMKRTLFSISDGATLVLGLGALALAWLAWQNIRTPEPRVVTSTPVPEWSELVRVATWPIGRAGAAEHESVLLLEQDCRGCDGLLRAIDSLGRRNGTSVDVGYVFFERFGTKGALEVFVIAECANEQGLLSEYLNGLFAAADPARYGRASVRRLGLNETRLRDCGADPHVRAILQRQTMAARQLGLRQGPALLLDGFLFVAPISVRSLDSALSSAQGRKH